MNETIKALSELYRPYTEVIKPLLALIEAEREEFPLPLYNEVRALNDHVARILSGECADPEEEFNRAQRHISRLNLDCFKWLNITFEEKLSAFRKDLRNIDLTKINNGEFYTPFKQHILKAKRLVKEAKILESKGATQDALVSYQKAFNEYCDAQEMTETIDWIWAKKLYSKARPIIQAILWLMILLIGWCLDTIFEYFVKA